MQVLPVRLRIVTVALCDCDTWASSGLLRTVPGPDSTDADRPIFHLRIVRYFICNRPVLHLHETTPVPLAGEAILRGQRPGSWWTTPTMSSRSILCPVDFSPASLVAVSLASEEAVRRNATLDLVHVWLPGLDMTGEVPPIPLSQKPPVETLARELRSLAVDLPDDGVGIHVKGGDPVDAIVQLAEALGSELLVLGTHASDELPHWMIGSVCRPLLERSPCPLLICRGPAKPSPSNQSLPSANRASEHQHRDDCQ